MGEFSQALRAAGIDDRASTSSIIRMCDAGEIECERRGPQGQRYIPAREFARVLRSLNRDT